MVQPKHHEFNENIVCKLCSSYLIDPVTVILCMHSFCRACLVKHLKETQTCPECKIQLGPKLPKAFRRDLHLQSLVFKMLPDLYWSEVKLRTDYVNKRTLSQDEINFLLNSELTSLARHLCRADERVPACFEYIRSAPTQDEADEDPQPMDWTGSAPRESVAGKVGVAKEAPKPNSSSLSVVSEDQPGPSGLAQLLAGGSVEKSIEASPRKNDMLRDKELGAKDAGNCGKNEEMDKNRMKMGIGKAEQKDEKKVASLPPPEFKRHFCAIATAKLSSFRKILEGKLKVRENGVQLLFLDSKRDQVLEDDCTLRDVAYMFGWDRRGPIRILFTLKHEPVDDEPPVLQMEEMPILFAEEPSGYTDEEMVDHSTPVFAPVLPQLTVTLDAAAMESSGNSQPIIVAGPAQPPRKRRKISSPTKRASRTPPNPVQRMVGVSPLAKGPPPFPVPPILQPHQPRRNLLNPAALNGSMIASGVGFPQLTPCVAQAQAPPAKLEGKNLSTGDKQDNLNLRIQEILQNKGLPSPVSSAVSVPASVASPPMAPNAADIPGPSRITSCIASAPQQSPNGVPMTQKGSPHPSSQSQPSTSCIVSTSNANTTTNLRAIQPRQDKVNYEEFVRRYYMQVQRFCSPGGAPHPLLIDPSIAHAPIKSFLSVPQTNNAPYLRPPPPNPYPNIIQHLALNNKRKHQQ